METAKKGKPFSVGNDNEKITLKIVKDGNKSVS